MMVGDSNITGLPSYQLRAQGEAILRIAGELEDFLSGEENVPKSLFDDLRLARQIGEWLVGATSINLITKYHNNKTDGGRRL